MWSQFQEKEKERDSDSLPHLANLLAGESLLVPTWIDRDWGWVTQQFENPGLFVPLATNVRLVQNNSPMLTFRHLTAGPCHSGVSLTLVNVTRMHVCIIGVALNKRSVG